MKSKILIFGKGFIGERLRAELSCEISQKRVSSIADAEEELARYNPKIIINCIGYTGDKNVDGCELEKDKTLSSNVFVPIIMAEAALRNRVKFIHISSGCIYQYDYGKDKPVAEEKMPDFFDLYYSRTKIYAERVLEALSRKFDVLIARIRIPLDNRPHPRNILTKLIKYKKAIVLANSLTYMPDFIKALNHLIKIDARGIYNVVNKGALRYPELLDIYKEYVPGYEYETIDFKKLNLTRTNLIMSTGKLEKTGFKVRPIKEVLRECVKDYIKY